MEITVTTKGGTEITLKLEVSVSGSYRPAFINGDPDVCHEAEYPEIEYCSDAKLRLKNGKWIDYSVYRLGDQVRARIQREVEHEVERGQEEPDREPPDDYDDDYDGP